MMSVEVLINELRDNARLNLSKVARKYKIPVTTVYYLLDKLQKNNIKKHTSLLDFESLNYSREIIIIPDRTFNEDSLNLTYFINNSYKTNKGVMLECVFKSEAERKSFLMNLKNNSFVYENHQVHEVLKSESFKIS